MVFLGNFATVPRIKIKKVLANDIDI